MDRKPRTATRGKTAATRARVAKSTATSPQHPTQEEIAQRAHELYVQSGRQSGRELEFWLEAERQLEREVKV